MCVCVCVCVCKKDLDLNNLQWLIWHEIKPYRRREMDTARRVQILDETDCVSYSTNFGKGMNPIILPPAMGK